MREVSPERERQIKQKRLQSFLPTPLNVMDYTPLPWFCYVFLKGYDLVFDYLKFDLPMFVTFGDPLIFLKKRSFSFDSKEQTAYIMLRFRERNIFSHHQVRFDVSGKKTYTWTIKFTMIKNHPTKS
jgi:hypothetical protein